MGLKSDFFQRFRWSEQFSGEKRSCIDHLSGEDALDKNREFRTLSAKVRLSVRERLFVFVVRVSGPLKRDTSYTGKTNAPLSLSFDEGDPLKVMDGCAILPVRAIVMFFFSLLAS